MFVRKRKSSWKKRYTRYSFQLIETYREGSKVRQRVLCNIGAARSAGQAACWYGKRLPDEYRDQILHMLDCMARCEPPIDDGPTLEEIEQSVQKAPGQA